MPVSEKYRSRPSLDHQAMAVWIVETKQIAQDDLGGMTMGEFTRSLAAARVTLNLIAANADLREKVEAAATTFAASRVA
jgi:hypothetical protein